MRAITPRGEVTSPQNPDTAYGWVPSRLGAGQVGTITTQNSEVTSMWRLSLISGRCSGVGLLTRKSFNSPTGFFLAPSASCGSRPLFGDDILNERFVHAADLTQRHRVHGRPSIVFGTGCGFRAKAQCM